MNVARAAATHLCRGPNLISGGPQIGRGLQMTTASQKLAGLPGHAKQQMNPKPKHEGQRHLDVGKGTAQSAQSAQFDLDSHFLVADHLLIIC